MKTALLRPVGVKVSLVIVVLGLIAMLVVSRKHNGTSSGFWLTHPVRVSLLSNREVAGLEFAYFTLSNRTDRPVRYLRDPKAEQPSYSLIETSVRDPLTGRVTKTNHNQNRLGHIVPTDLPPHASVHFTVRYPSEVTNGMLKVSYRQTRGRFQSFVYNLTQRIVGNGPVPSDAYDSVQLRVPFDH